MHSSHRFVSRLGFTMVGLVCFATIACTSSNPSPNPSPNSSSNPSVSPTAETAVTSTPVDNTAKDNPKEQFAAMIGTQQDGWLPKVLAGKGLKKGLTPAATGAIIPGAEQVSEFGFSKVTVSDVPGLKQYEFYYAADDSGKPARLEAVKLHFDPALNSAYPDLVNVLSDKYGAVQPEDVEKEMIVWVGPGFVTAQLTKQVTDFGGYELNVSLEKQ